MSEETQTIEETTTEAVPATVEIEVEKAASAEPKPIDLEVEIAAKEAIAEKLASGEITQDEAIREVAKRDRNIIKGQRELIKPAQAVQEAESRRDADRKYWQNWGKAAKPDVAQMEFGKTITTAKAQDLYAQARAEVEANPRYANRAELNVGTLVYDRWMNAMEAETKKKPATKAETNTETRITGSGGSSPAASPAAHKTARQKLEDGDYDGELKRFAGE